MINPFTLITVRSFTVEPCRKLSMRWIAFGLTLWLLLCTQAQSKLVYSDNLWKGLIAEATSDGYDGMYAVACCVRNRLSKGMNTGLCGLKRRNLDEFVQKEGKQRETMAKRIVQEVFERGGRDTTFGATHFECVERYGKPYWAKTMSVCCKIGEHTFYK